MKVKVSIIGAGNMGGAVARGLAEAKDKYEVRVSNPSVEKLEAIKADFPHVITTGCNFECAQGADIIILGVKPWKVKEVIDELKPIWSSEADTQSILVSMAAGIDIAALRSMAGEGISIYKAIPNTAVSVKCGVTFVSREKPDEQSDRIVADLFSTLGLTEIVEERMLDAGMAVASCGMAFMMRMLRAMTEGGVELGLYASTALRAAAATMRGAAELIEENGLHPEQEVDKVTTPGGITIRGLNAMEEAGFTGAVIKGLRACVK